MNILPILDIFENIGGMKRRHQSFLTNLVLDIASNRLVSSIILLTIAVFIQHNLPNLEVLFLLNGAILLNYLQNILPNKMFVKACDMQQIVLTEEGEVIENPLMHFGYDQYDPNKETPKFRLQPPSH